MLPSSKRNATDEQPWFRKDVEDSRNRTVYTDWPGNNSLYLNYRKGNSIPSYLWPCVTFGFYLVVQAHEAQQHPLTTPLCLGVREDERGEGDVNVAAATSWNHLRPGQSV